MDMTPFTLHDLRSFDAVVREGGFQAAASVLHRSHPAVFAAVARLERQLGIALLERGGYRVGLTAAGRSFHARAQALLREFDGLQAHASQLAMGEETDLHVVLGDLCPHPQLLGLLAGFFAGCPQTRLHLHFEAVTGPWERLFEDDAGLIVHRIDKRDARLEWIDLCDVPLVPVVSPTLLGDTSPRAATPALMRGFTQCVMRDTARDPPPDEYFVLDGAPRCIVADQAMKKDIILQGLGWGHVPRFLVQEELRDGRLLSLAGRHFPGRVEQLVAARRRDRPHGPVAQRLWASLRAQAPGLRAELQGRKAGPARRAARALPRRR
jgi:DNA-binding transcriptional LysR family regulator